MAVIGDFGKDYNSLYKACFFLLWYPKNNLQRIKFVVAHNEVFTVKKVVEN